MFKSFLSIVLGSISIFMSSVTITCIYNWHIGSFITALPTISIFNSFCVLLLLSAVKTNLFEITKDYFEKTSEIDEKHIVMVNLYKTFTHSVLLGIGWILHLFT